MRHFTLSHLRPTHRSPFARTLSGTLAGCTVALLAALTAAPIAAQQLLAYYPLIKDLNDLTRNYGPVMLTGNPTPPAQPSNGVCVNGIYRYSTGGQDVSTPAITKLDPTDFQFDVDFKITSLPTSTAPVIIAGNLWRWLGIYLQSNGTVGFKYNNSNYTYSTRKLTTGTWYSAVVKYKKGRLRLLIDSSLVHQTTLPTLNWGNRTDQKNFTTNDFSNGRAFNGCIRNLRIWNNPVWQPLIGSPPTISIATGGTHTFTLDAGAANASRLYWIFGSLTGTSPGVTLLSGVGSVTIPLVPDFYTTITIAQPNTSILAKTKSALDATGQGQASLVVPKINDQNAIGVTFYHAYLVYDASNNFHMASNPVTMKLVQ